MSTIEAIYSEIIKEGVRRGYDVVPEFCVAHQNKFRKKIDVVWLVPREESECTGSLRYWKIIAAFEIEGYDVPLGRIRNHSEQFKKLQEGYQFPCFIPLWFNDVKPLTEENWTGMQDEIGNHGEVKAVDAELQKIEAAEGRPATPEDLNKILLHNTQVPPKGSPVTDEAMPRCPHCQGITKGVKLTPELAEAEGVRQQVPVDKSLPLNPPAPPGEEDDRDGGSGGAGNTGGGGEEGASGVDSLFND